MQTNSVKNSLICPRAKSSSHCLTELFSIYQNKNWTIRRRYDHIVVPLSNRIKLKIDWFQVKRDMVTLVFYGVVTTVYNTKCIINLKLNTTQNISYKKYRKFISSKTTNLTKSALKNQPKSLIRFHEKHLIAWLV